MKFIGIIPARYASTRFPGKPLAIIGGKTMIQRVFEQASKCNLLSHVVVATDNQEIYRHVQSFGNAVMTSPLHQSGTDRCFEAASLLSIELQLADDDVILNIQGDEPFIHPNQLASVARIFETPDIEIATLIKKISDPSHLSNENIVKVVVDKFGKALYFSRHPIPFQRGTPLDQWLLSGDYYSHIGLYAYKLRSLRRIAALEPGSLERAESLEQLRWLQNGFQVHVAITPFQSPAIDTPEDLRIVEAGHSDNLLF